MLPKTDPVPPILAPPFGPMVGRSTPALHAARPPELVLNAVITPKTGRDIVALVFLLLMLPQGISCLILAAYILLGSFKLMAGRLVARFVAHLPDSDDDSEWDDLLPTSRHAFYRTQLVGQFLLLFSVNSFILLVYHYTLPKLWLQYLVIFAKCIVASRLVGSYTTGSTTYVSVVLSGATVTTTTTTSSSGANGCAATKEWRYSMSNLVNSLLGFAFVICIDSFLHDFILCTNIPQVAGDIVRFYRNLANSSASPHDSSYEFSYESLFMSLFTKSPFLASIGYFRANRAGSESRRLLWGRLSFLSNAIIHVSINYLNLSDASVQRISVVMRETGVVVNFAYLVLCIHVIGLTILPFLQKVFIFKDYSKTLDHLSTLTPDVPYQAFRRPGPVHTLARDTSAESVHMVYVESQKAAQAMKQTPLDIHVKSDVAEASPSKLSTSSFSATSSTVCANNFKVFCVMQPANKVTVHGSRTSHNKTIVDRKRSNSNSVASTTIMDKYFTFSIQPIWSWLAAIKILLVSPTLFAGAVTKEKSSGSPFLHEQQGPRVPTAVFDIGESEATFEVLDKAVYEELLKEEFHVKVNTCPWYHVELQLSESDILYIKVYGLTPGMQYEIVFCSPCGGHAYHVITTKLSTEPSYISVSQQTNGVSTLRASLTHTLTQLAESKALLRRSKKEESKKSNEIRKHIDSTRAKIDRFGPKELQEGRLGSKLKGLQSTITQLEHEIADLKVQFEKGDAEDYNDLEPEEEHQLHEEIELLQKFIDGFELSTSKLKNNVRNAESDKNGFEHKKAKLESRLKARKVEIVKLNVEVRSMKKALLAKFQRRQKRIYDRLDNIIPQLEQATDALTSELEQFVQGPNNE